jgi:hypothetical protein
MMRKLITLWNMPWKNSLPPNGTMAYSTRLTTFLLVMGTPKDIMVFILHFLLLFSPLTRAQYTGLLGVFYSTSPLFKIHMPIEQIIRTVMLWSMFGKGHCGHLENWLIILGSPNFPHNGLCMAGSIIKKCTNIPPSVQLL